MKQILITLLLALTATTLSAKDWKTVVFTTTPQMHCEGCENKIKGNLRFEKGVKDVQTSVPDQTVTITYDPKKTDADKLSKAFQRFGYTVCPAPTAATATDKAACSDCPDASDGSATGR